MKKLSKSLKIPLIQKEKNKLKIAQFLVDTGGSLVL